jgi:endonuclease/exonuclease/phosphatase family metal-dependent hydrolase
VTRRREVAAAFLAGAVAIALWVLAASRPGLWLSGCERDCANAGRSPGPLRVLQLNMLHGFPQFAHLQARIDLIVDEIQRRQADVVLLEEVPWTIKTGSVVSELARRTDMDHLSRRANGNRRGILFEEGDAILSRFPMRDSATTELPRGNHFFQHRIALSATLDTPWGPIRAVVAHLSGDSAKVSAAQIEALHDFAGSPGYPGIVGGDFNARADSPAVVALAQEWTDVLAAANPPDTRATCCVDDVTAPPNTELQERIDYLWITDADRSHIVEASRILVQPQRVGEGWLRASDHAGLFATIDLSR